MTHHETIVALATPSGAGAIAVIRLSGEDAINIASKIFHSISGKDLAKQKNPYGTFGPY
jgi:tRNA modification GTPase